MLTLYFAALQTMLIWVRLAASPRLSLPFGEKLICCCMSQMKPAGYSRAGSACALKLEIFVFPASQQSSRAEVIRMSSHHPDRMLLLPPARIFVFLSRILTHSSHLRITLIVGPRTLLCCHCRCLVQTIDFGSWAYYYVVVN
jgi:hypothetical protein